MPTAFTSTVKTGRKLVTPPDNLIAKGKNCNGLYHKHVNKHAYGLNWTGLKNYYKFYKLFKFPHNPV